RQTTFGDASTHGVNQTNYLRQEPSFLKRRGKVAEQVNWKRALRTCADPERAGHFYDLVSATSARAFLKDCSPEQIHLLVALFSGSKALSTLLVLHPDWVALLDPKALKFARRKQGLNQELNSRFKPKLEARDYPAALACVREFKQRDMLRIAA